MNLWWPTVQAEAKVLDFRHGAAENHQRTVDSKAIKSACRCHRARPYVSTIAFSLAASRTLVPDTGSPNVVDRTVAEYSFPVNNATLINHQCTREIGCVYISFLDRSSTPILALTLGKSTTETHGMHSGYRNMFAAWVRDQTTQFNTWLGYDMREFKTMGNVVWPASCINGGLPQLLPHDYFCLPSTYLCCW